MAEIIKPKTDVAFKRIFTSGSLKPLRSMIASVLGIDKDSLGKLTVTKNELPPKFFKDKFSRIDVNVEVNGKKINIEMQCLHFDDFAERSLFYWAALYTNDFRSGQDYSELLPTICINIVDAEYFEKEDFHSVFRLQDIDTHNILTENIEIHFLELKKIAPLQERIEKSNTLKLWMQFLNARTEADLDMIKNTGILEMEEAVNEVRILSADEQARQEIFLREAQINDEVNYYASARRKGLAEGRAEGISEGISTVAENLRKLGVSEEIIKQATKQ